MDRSGRRRRAVSTELVDQLVAGVLAAVETAPDGGWLYRCRQPDPGLVLRAVDNLRAARKHGTYQGTLCRRTVGRALRRVWRLCSHLPEAQLRPAPSVLGRVA